MILLGWDCCIIWIVGTCKITWLSRIEHQTRWLVQPRRAPGINLSRQVSRSLQFRSMGAFSPKITVHAGGAHQLFRLRWQFVRSGHENLPQRATLTHHPLPPSQLRVCVRGRVSCCEHSLLGRDFILGSLAQPSCKLRPFPFCSYFFFFPSLSSTWASLGDWWMAWLCFKKQQGMCCENNEILRCGHQSLGLHRFNFARFRNSFSFHGFLNTPTQS